MTNVTFNNSVYPVKEEQTVLEALEEGGAKIPYSCRVGLCHACMMKADKPVPPDCQQGLSNLQQSQHYFLACQCFPDAEMKVKLPNTNDAILAMLHNKRTVTDSVIEVQLIIDKPWFAGQTITIFKEPGLGLEYCLTRLDQSTMAVLMVDTTDTHPVNQWLCTVAPMNKSLLITSPQGVCHYSTDAFDYELLLVSSSLATPALVGIVSDAINKKHASGIKAYYQVNDSNMAYVEKLKALASNNQQLTLCEVGDDVLQVVAASETELRNNQVFLLGDNAMVGSLQRHCFFKGAINSHIKTAFFGPKLAE